MKTLKKLAALIMCVVIAAGCLSGCGGVNDEETLTSAVKSINSAKSFDMVAKTTGKTALKMGDISQDMNMNSEIKSTQFTDPLKAKVISSTKLASTAVETESYLQKENGNYVVYAKTEDTWSKVSLGDMESALSTSGLNYVQNQLEEDVSKYTKKEDRDVEGKKYLVYEYTVSGEEVKKMIGGATSSVEGLFNDAEESEKMEKVLNDMVKDIGDITMTILIDRDKKVIYQIEYSMTEMMNTVMKSLTKTISDMEVEEGKDAGNPITFDVKEMDMTVTYSNIDSAADFEIPKEALEAEEVDLSGASSSESEESPTESEE